MIINKAIISGSFDPIHLGHLNIILRSIKIFKEITILIASSEYKKYTFSTNERKIMIKKSIENIKGISIAHINNKKLLSKFCSNNNISIIIRGIRSVIDLDYEKSMSTFNKQLGNLETIFLYSDSQYTHISSSLIKEIAKKGGNFKYFVPHSISKQISDKFI